jgi:SAM-dependent methyltransferase
MLRPSPSVRHAAPAPALEIDAFEGRDPCWDEYVREAHERLDRGEIEQEYERLVAPLVDRPPRRILDVGAGPATFLCAMHRLFPAAELRGVDAAETHVARARADLAWRGVPATLERGDAERLAFGAGAFDLVVCQAVMPYARDDRAFLAELRRVLAPDGVLWLAVHGLGFYLERLAIPGLRGRLRNAASVASGALSMATGVKLVRDTPVTSAWLRGALEREGFVVGAVEGSRSAAIFPKLIRVAARARA